MSRPPIYDPSVRPFGKRDPECRGCGHPPHLAGQCKRRTFFLKRECGCDVDASYPEPEPSPNWRRPPPNPQDRCGAYGCSHTRAHHRDADDGTSSFCRRCFDLNPRDDSLIEGGVYHRFVE